MSYLARLKAKIGENIPDTEATKGTKGAFDPFVATESALLHSNFAAHDHVNRQLPVHEMYEERAAIMEFDGQLDRISAEKCAHAIVFCQDCTHHIPQPDIISRSGYAHATPSGCELGLITSDTWPPIYSFTGWFCSHYLKASGIPAINSDVT